MLFTIKPMKSCYLDANVLIYYKNEESPYFKKANQLIQTLVKEDCVFFVSPLVLDEFLYAIKFLLQRRKIKRSDIFRLLKRSLREILDLPNLGIANPPLGKGIQMRIISLMEEFGLSPRDAYHLLIMQEDDIHHFVTFDKDFKEVFKRKILLPVNP